MAADVNANTSPIVAGGEITNSNRTMSIANTVRFASLRNSGRTRGLSSFNGAISAAVETPMRIPGAVSTANGIHATMNGRASPCRMRKPQSSGRGRSSNPATGNSIPSSAAMKPGITRRVPSQTAPVRFPTLGSWRTRKIVVIQTMMT